MTVDEVMAKLEKLGSEQTVKTYRRHGAAGELYGVKVGDLKKMLKHLKGDQPLALQLWKTNNSDAMYLAALIADGSQMSKKQLDEWARTAWWYLLSEWAVPSVAADHPDAPGLARKWIRARKASVASTGWSTYASYVGMQPDELLDLEELRNLLRHVEQHIEHAPNRVRYTMNGFVIAVGCFVKPLVKAAKATAKRVGPVHVDVGETACKVPLAVDYIAKVESMGRIGKKRKHVMC